MTSLYPPSPSRPISRPIALPDLPVKVWGATDRGREREGNEDSIYPNSASGTSDLKPKPERLEHKGHLLIVADGIGGTQAGRQASQWVIRVASEQYYDSPGPDLGADLRAAVEYANASLYQYLQSMHLQRAGSTMVAAVIHHNMLHVASVGDSRAYLIRDDQIIQQTTDHTLTQQKIERGLIRSEQASMDPDRSVLTRSMGAGPSVKVDLLPPLPLQLGDVVLLCSDGLPDMLSDQEIANLAKGSPRQAAKRLIAAANRKGGYDNISVVVAQMGSKKPSQHSIWQRVSSQRKILSSLPRPQKSILVVLAILAAVTFGVLLGWVTGVGQGDNRFTLTSTSMPITQPSTAATAATKMAVTPQPTAKGPPGQATVTLVPTITTTNTPAPVSTFTLGATATGMKPIEPPATPCPDNKVWNGQTCGCPAPMIWTGIWCYDSGKEDGKNEQNPPPRPGGT